MTQEKFDELDAFFNAEKANAKHGVSDDLMARILQDAATVQAAAQTPEPVRKSSGFSFGDIWRGLGGAPAMAAFAASTMLGVGLGYSLPLSDYLIASDEVLASDEIYTGTVLADIQTLYAEE